MTLELVKVYWTEQLKLSALKTDKKARLRLMGLIAILVYAFVMVYSFCSSLAMALDELGRIDILPELLLTAASMLVILSSLFSARDLLFSYRDREMLSAMPISKRTLVGSRVIIMLSYEVAYTVILTLPMFIVCGKFFGGGLYYILCALFGCLLTAVIPALCGAALGTAMSALLSGFKGAKFLRYLVLTIIALGIMAVSMSQNLNGESLSAADIDKISGTLGAVRSVLPCVRLFSEGLAGSAVKLIIFVLLNIAAIAVFILAVGALSPIIAERTAAGTHGRVYNPQKKHRARNLGKVLLWREVKLYIGSPLYVFNTAFGLLLLIIVAVALAVFRNGRVVSDLIMMLGDSFADTIPFLFGMLLAMCEITASSISIEGKRIWLIRSMPIPAGKILASKFLLNFILDAGVAVIASTAMMFTFPMKTATRIMAYLLPLAYSLFSSLLGLTVNLLMPKLDWTNEAAVVKQSGAVTVSTLVGMTVGLIPMIFAGIFGSPVSYITAAALIGASLMLVLWLSRKGVRRFCEL